MAVGDTNFPKNVAFVVWEVTRQRSLKGAAITLGQTVEQMKLICGPWHIQLAITSSGGQCSFSSTLLWRGQFTLKTGEAMSPYSEAMQDMYCTVVVTVLALQCSQAYNFAAPKCSYLLQRYLVSRHWISFRWTQTSSRKCSQAAVIQSKGPKKG